MKLAVALLLMSTTLGAGSAVLAAGQGSALMPDAVITRPAPAIGPDAVLTQIADDGDEGRRTWLWVLSGDDDDDEEDDDDGCEEEDDDDGCTTGNTGNPAGSGTVAPPNNGLFTNGTAPVVTSN